MVVRHLRVVKHLLALLQRFATQGLDEGSIELLSGQLGEVQSVHDLRALGIDIVRQEGGIDTRIGGELLLIETLDELQRGVGREAELLVAIYLQARQVIEPGRELRAALLGDGEYGEGVVEDGLQNFLAFRLRGILHDLVDGSLGLLRLALPGSLRYLRGILSLRILVAGYGVETHVTVERGEHPGLPGHEVLYLLLPPHDEGQRGGLYASYGEHLPLSLPVLEGVEARGIHAQGPVTDGTGQSGLIERLVLLLVLEIVEALAYGFFGEGGYPQPFHWAGGTGFLHHPALDEFSLLSGISAVHDFLGGLHEPLYDAELLLYALVGLQFDAEAGRYHGQLSQAPCLPLGIVLMGLLQFTQVSEGPRHLVAVALQVAVMLGMGSQNVGDVPGYGGFLCYAHYHTPSTRFVSSTKSATESCSGRLLNSSSERSVP